MGQKYWDVTVEETVTHTVRIAAETGEEAILKVQEILDEGDEPDITEKDSTGLSVTDDAAVFAGEF